MKTLTHKGKTSIFSKYFTIKSLVLLGVYFWLLAPNVLAQWKETGASDGDLPAEFRDLESVFANILGLLVAFAGVAVFIMFIVGGYRLMFAAGDPQKNAQARATLTWAVIGLLFLLGSWLIMKFISEFTGVDVTTLCIPGVTPDVNCF